MQEFFAAKVQANYNIRSADIWTQKLSADVNSGSGWPNIEESLEKSKILDFFNPVLNLVRQSEMQTAENGEKVKQALITKHGAYLSQVFEVTARKSYVNC